MAGNGIPGSGQAAGGCWVAQRAHHPCLGSCILVPLFPPLAGCAAPGLFSQLGMCGWQCAGVGCQTPWLSSIHPPFPLPAFPALQSTTAVRALPPPYSAQQGSVTQGSVTHRVTPVADWEELVLLMLSPLLWFFFRQWHWNSIPAAPIHGALAPQSQGRGTETRWEGTDLGPCLLCPSSIAGSVFVTWGGRCWGFYELLQGAQPSHMPTPPPPSLLLSSA